MNLIDVQVNGYAGISFNDQPLTDEQIQHAAQRLIADGVRAILPTVITDDLGRMAMRLQNLRTLIDQDPTLGQLMPAFHIEGPCISPLDGYRGAHPLSECKEATPDVFKPLIEAAGGPGRIAIITLAPEHDPNLATTAWLADQGILVAGGHTDAPLKILQEAENAGMKMYTHLGNGCAATMNRHDNIISRVMSLKTIMYSLVPDGYHVPFWLCRQWIDWLSMERCIFTTDCMDAAGTEEGFEPALANSYVDFTGHTPVCRVKNTPYLAGSALTMKKGYQNATEQLGLSQVQADAMWCSQPAKLIASHLS